MERVNLGPPWQVAQLKPGWTKPTVLKSVCPAWAPGSLAGTGALAERMVATKAAIASSRASRPVLAKGKKFVTPGGVESCSPLRATDRLPRWTQEPVGVPGFPVGPDDGLFATVYSRMVVWSAPVP